MSKNENFDDEIRRLNELGTSEKFRNKVKEITESYKKEWENIITNEELTPSQKSKELMGSFYKNLIAKYDNILNTPIPDVSTQKQLESDDKTVVTDFKTKLVENQLSTMNHSEQLMVERIRDLYKKSISPTVIAVSSQDNEARNNFSKKNQEKEKATLKERVLSFLGFNKKNSKEFKELQSRYKRFPQVPNHPVDLKNQFTEEDKALETRLENLKRNDIETETLIKQLPEVPQNTIEPTTDDDLEQRLAELRDQDSYVAPAQKLPKSNENNEPKTSEEYEQQITTDFLQGIKSSEKERKDDWQDVHSNEVTKRKMTESGMDYKDNKPVLSEEERNMILDLYTISKTSNVSIAEHSLDLLEKYGKLYGDREVASVIKNFEQGHNSLPSGYSNDSRITNTQFEQSVEDRFKESKEIRDILKTKQSQKDLRSR